LHSFRNTSRNEEAKKVEHALLGCLGVFDAEVGGDAQGLRPRAWEEVSSALNIRHFGTPRSSWTKGAMSRENGWFSAAMPGTKKLPLPGRTMFAVPLLR